VLQIPKNTFSRISCQQQANGGIGWLDEGIAKYNKIYDLVEVDHQLRGDTFNQELLKVHQRRCRRNKKGTGQTVDNERSKKQKPRDDLRRTQDYWRRQDIMQF
jgi:hypothetical protein